MSQQTSWDCLRYLFILAIVFAAAFALWEIFNV